MGLLAHAYVISGNSDRKSLSSHPALTRHNFRLHSELYSEILFQAKSNNKQIKAVKRKRSLGHDFNMKKNYSVKFHKIFVSTFLENQN